MISGNLITANSARIPSLVERHSFAATADTTVHRSVMRRNKSDTTASVCSFALMYQKERTPGNIANCLCETMILQQIQDLQILKIDGIELAHKLKTQFVKEIFALIDNFQVLFCQPLNGLRSIRAPQFLTAYASLGGFQPALGLLQKVRVINHFAGRDRTEIGEVQVHARDIAGFGDQRRVRFFDGKDDIPSIGLTLDRTSFNLAFNGPMQSQPHGPNLSQVQFVAIKFETRLRVGERIEKSLSLESWKSRLLLACLNATKERIEGLTEPSQRVLQYLAVNGRYVLSLLFDRWKLNRLSMVVDRSMGNSVGIAAFLKSCVVQFSAHVKYALHFGNHTAAWCSEFVFICLQTKPLYHVISLYTRSSGFSAMGLIYPRLKPGVLRPAE